MKRISYDFPLWPALVCNLLAFCVMWLCRGTVGGEDVVAVAVFQLIVLLLANEFWATCLFIPVILLGLKNLPPEEVHRRMGRLLRWTSPGMLAAPVAAWLLVCLLLRTFDVCCLPYAAWWDALPGQLGSTSAGLAVLFVLNLFKPVIPLSVISLVLERPDVAEVQHEDFRAVDGPPELPATDIEVRHSEWYGRHESQMRGMLQPGERILLATAPDVAMLRKYSPQQKTGAFLLGGILCAVFTAVVAAFAFRLEGLQSVAVFVAAGIGVVLTAGMLGTVVSRRQESRRRDYFITTERFCRFSGSEKPYCVAWKDVENVSLSLPDGSETGNVHLPRKSVITKTLGKLFGAKAKEAPGAEQGHLQGLECVPSAAAVYSLIRGRMDKLSD